MSDKCCTWTHWKNTAHCPVCCEQFRMFRDLDRHFSLIHAQHVAKAREEWLKGNRKVEG